jgi:hypothetical protein
MALLRRVETHIRVMGERDNLTLTDRTIDYRDASLPCEGSFQGFTQVHRDDSRFATSFFDRALSKIASSAAAGQSHTVLVCGPPKSGRSQTMYDVMGPGLVHLTAAALLAIPEATVHYAAFHVRDMLCIDSFSEQPVAVTEMPAPVGPLPLSAVRALEKPEDAVVVPTGKRTSSSCFVTFHVYKRMSNPDAAQRKDTFAIVTFVDLCSFEDAPFQDTQLLGDCVDRINKGVDPQFNRCMLTRLLEPSLVGGRSTCVVTAVTGNKSTSRAACLALDFTARIGRIGQIAPLCQMNVPRWADELPRDIHHLDAERHMRIEKAYAAGVASIYDRLLSFVQSKQDGNRARLAEDEELDGARRKMQAALAARLETVSGGGTDFHSQLAELSQETKRCRTDADEFDRQAATSHQQFRDHEAELKQIRSVRQDIDAAGQLELVKLDSAREVLEKEVRELDARSAAFRDAIADATGRTSILEERVRRAALIMNRNNALAKLDAKRRRVEDSLDEAAVRAKERYNSMCDERQRKSAAARVSHVEAKIVAKTASLAGLRGQSRDVTSPVLSSRYKAGASRSRRVTSE